MIGQLLARRYQVLQVLGAGGFGQTYITADLHLPGQPQCVLKHLQPASATPEVLEIARKLFQKEAETLQKLGNHDQIPRLLAYFEENQEFYLVQELVVGHTLTYELGSSQQWSETGILRLLREVLEILNFVHGQGVIHRDVKPDNIMRRDNDGKLVLIDFGAIKEVRNQQLAVSGEVTKTVAIGTPGYMPMEQAGGTPRPNSDIYALGVICIQALTGLHPTELTVNDATGELQWQHLVSVSPNLVAMLTKMTRYHFKDRYGTASEAIQALQNLSAGTTRSPLPSQPLNRPSVPITHPTTATRVVSPSSNQQTVTYERPVVFDPRPENKPRRGIGKWIGGMALLGGSAILGYLWVKPQLSIAQFESLVQTDRCRLAAPKRNIVTKVRDLPDRTASITSAIKAGEKLLYVSSQEEFVQIQQRNGQSGWVFNDQIDGCPGISTIPVIPTPSPSITKPIKSPVVKKTPVVKPTPSSPTPSPSDNSTLDPSISPIPSSPDISPSVSLPLTPLPTPSSPLPTPNASTPSEGIEILPSNPTLPPDLNHPSPLPS